MPHNVALVDDHHLMRASLAQMVNAMRGYRVSLEAGHGRELIELLSRTAKNDTPRIAIVDLSMPVMDGFDTIAWLHAQAPLILPIALTFDGDMDTVARAIRLGARGFLLKTVRPEMLNKALDDLIHTGYHGGPASPDPPSPAWDTAEDQGRMRAEVLEKITPQELEFLLLTCDEAEYPTNEVAARMSIPRSALDDLRNSLSEKFGLTTKTALILFALRWGLLPGRK